MVTLSIILFILIIGLSLYDEHVQPGLLAIAAGLSLSLLIGGWSYAETIQLFPTSLFLTLSGILLFFSAAVSNGTIENAVQFMLRNMPGHPTLIPFALAGAVALLTSLGVGNIGATAILAPAAMAASRQIGLRPFLMILLIVGAANAGALSPLAVTGVLTRELLAARPESFRSINISEFGSRLFVISFLVQTVISILGFFLLGGYSWIRTARSGQDHVKKIDWNTAQKFTLVLIALFILVLLFCSSPLIPEGFRLRRWGSQVSAVAFVMLSVLLIFKGADARKTFAIMPWTTIMMICGIIMYIEIASKAGAVDAITQMLEHAVPGAFLLPLLFGFSALLSVFSSSSGVVMPLFISLAPGLETSGFSAAAIITGVAISAHLVDTSPLSSLGALCIAASDTHERSPGLYRALLIWALTMVPVGALISWLIAWWKL